MQLSEPISPRRFLSRTAGGLVLIALLIAASLAACQSGQGEEEDTGTPPVVDVTAVDYAFQAPDTIPSGWVTFRMENQGEETHYFELHRLPDTVTFEELRQELEEPLDSLRQSLRAGKIDTSEFEKAFDRTLPDWATQEPFSDPAGGMPLLAPGRAAQATHKMEPGTYTMACIAVRSPDGRRHVHLGMDRPITVTETSTGASPPEPDVTMRAAGHEVTTEGEFRAGQQTGAYHVEEASEEMDDYYWSAMLARIENDADVSKLREWIKQGEYRNPVPVEYVGGFEYLSPGDTAYAELDLVPGRYAWHLHGEQDTVTTFTVE